MIKDRNVMSPVLRRKILQMHRFGKSKKMIADKLGISPFTVGKYIRLSGGMMTPHGSECGFTLPRQRCIVCDYLMGQQPDKIASKLHCADYRVMMVLWKFGLPERSVLRKVRRKQAVWMSETGMTAREISACFGVGTGMVSGWFKKEGFKPETVKPIPRRIRDMASSLWKQGNSLYAIGKELGISPNSVRNWLIQRDEY